MKINFKMISDQKTCSMKWMEIVKLLSTIANYEMIVQLTVVIVLRILSFRQVLSLKQG